MTKLDGTARGGILVALAEKYKLPVHFIGVGEGVDDLAPFTARDFARRLQESMKDPEKWEPVSDKVMPQTKKSRGWTKPSRIPLFKLPTELGPLLVFFVANAKFNLFVATGAFMVAIVVAMITSYVVTRPCR